MKNNQFVFLPVAIALYLTASITCVVAAADQLPETARVELCTGDVSFSKRDAQGVLTPGDTFQTAQDPNSRCRVVYPNGNVVNIASATTVKFGQAQQLTLLQGQVVAYAMPAQEQTEHPLILQVADGALVLNMGKVLVKTERQTSQIAIFNDLVAAVWRDPKTEKTLYPGNLVKLSAASVEITQAPRDLETRVSEQASPELPAVAQATQAYKIKDLVTAKRLFTQIQRAFPYNAAAAYHLGVLELNDNHVGEAVQQWQKYVNIDPEGAQKSGVTQQLTLMTTQSIRDEVKQAIAQENSLSTLPPEPNSIAVNPLLNKGDKKYQFIGKGLTAFIITDLAKIPGLKVLEREKLQTLLDEIKLSGQGGLVDNATWLRAGRLMRAEKLVLGDYLIETKQGEGQ